MRRIFYLAEKELVYIKAKKSKSRRIKYFYSCSWFFMSICGLCPLDIFSLCSNSIYCRFASIRYEINPSFAKQTYRAAVISSCVSNISKIPQGIYLDALCPQADITQIILRSKPQSRRLRELQRRLQSRRRCYRRARGAYL